MSRKVEHNEDFERNTLFWRDLTAFITAFITAFAILCHRQWMFMKPYLHTEMVGGAKMTSHRRGYVCNQVKSDSIFLNIMNNNLH